MMAGYAIDVSCRWRLHYRVMIAPHIGYYDEPAAAAILLLIQGHIVVMPRHACRHSLPVS